MSCSGLMLSRVRLGCESKKCESGNLGTGEDGLGTM